MRVVSVGKTNTCKVGIFTVKKSRPAGKKVSVQGGFLWRMDTLLFLVLLGVHHNHYGVVIARCVGVCNLFAVGID